MTYRCTHCGLVNGGKASFPSQEGCIASSNGKHLWNEFPALCEPSKKKKKKTVKVENAG